LFSIPTIRTTYLGKFRHQNSKEEHCWLLGQLRMLYVRANELNCAHKLIPHH